MPINTSSHEQLMQSLLHDPEFREEWERTAIARAVANRLLKYRIEHGLSQSALAKRLGVSQAVVGRWELGEHEPKLSTLQRLSRELGMSFSITIHPVDLPSSSPNDSETVERFSAHGVEMVVSSR